MNITYEKKEAMTFIGYYTQMLPEEGFRKCPEFWAQEYSAKYARLWQTMKPETPVEEAILANGIGMFGICADSESSFTYWIAGLYKGGGVPEGLELISFPAGRWAVFTTKGPVPGALQSLVTYVSQEWLPNEGRKYHADASTTLEVYTKGDMQSPYYESSIWMPIE